MAPFFRESWRPNSFLVKLNSVAGGVSSATDLNKPSEVHFRPRKAGLAPTESQSIGASETNSATQSSDATSTEQSAPASTEDSTASAPSATPATSAQVTPSASSDPLPSATHNTFVVEPSSSSIAVPSSSSTDERPTTAAPPQVPSTAPNAPVSVKATTSVSPTIIAPSPPPATPTQGTPNPGNGSPNSVPPAPVPSPNTAASQPSAVPQVPSPSGPAVIPPVATTASGASGAITGPESAPIPSRKQDEALPTGSQPLFPEAVPSSATLSTPSEISPAITPVPTSVAIRVGGGSVIDGTTFTDSSITQVITTTAASVVTSDGRTFTTSVAVESTRVLSTRVPVPTTGNAALGDSNSQKTKAIVGGAIGGAIICLSLAILAWVLCYRRRRAQERKLLEASVFMPDHYSPAPHRAVSVSSFGTTTTVTPRAVSPSLSEKSYSSRPGFNVTSQRKTPPPYLEDPLRHVRDRGNPFDIQSYQILPPGSSSRSNPAHIQPFATSRNPFDDPIHILPNPFDDPIGSVKGSSSSNGNVKTSTRVPSVVISPATPTASTMRHSATSSVDSGKRSISSGDYGMAM